MLIYTRFCRSTCNNNLVVKYSKINFNNVLSAIYLLKHTKIYKPLLALDIRSTPRVYTLVYTSQSETTLFCIIRARTRTLLFARESPSIKKLLQYVETPSLCTRRERGSSKVINEISTDQSDSTAQILGSNLCV